MQTSSIRLAAATLLAFACQPLLAHPGHGSELIHMHPPYAAGLVWGILAIMMIGMAAGRQVTGTVRVLGAAGATAIACGMALAFQLL